MVKYKIIHDPQEGEIIQFLGIYATRWPWHSGVEPTVAFIEDDSPDINAMLLEACKDMLQYIDVDNLTMQTKERQWKAAIAAATEAADD